LVLIILRWKPKGIQNCTNKGPVPFQRWDIHKNAKIGWGHLKNIFPRTTKPKTKKLRSIQKLPDIVQIQACKNYGPRGSDNGKNHFYMWLYWKKSLKIFFRTSRPISTKLDISKSSLHKKTFKFVQIKDQVLSKGEIIVKMQV
jgi:hypothetical protein